MEKNGGETIGCTVTGHHLHLDRRDVYRRGFRPDYFCWPVIQPDEHRKALGEFVLKGHPFTMLGDDAAGHPRESKECGCCAGGVYTGAVSLELYTEHFAEHGALDKLEGFTSLNGPRFYGIEPSEEAVTLVKSPWCPQNTFRCDDGTEVASYQHPDRDGKGTPPIRWKLAE